MNISTLLSTKSRIEAMKPRPQARGEGIRAVKRWKAMQICMLDWAISIEMMAEMERDWQGAIEFEPMLGDETFQRTGGLL